MVSHSATRPSRLLRACVRARSQMNDTGRTVRAELTANKFTMTSLRQRLGLLVSWTARAQSDRAQQAVGFVPACSLSAVATAMYRTGKTWL